MREIFRGGEGLSYDEGVKHLSNHPTKEKNTIDKPTQATGRKQSECIARIAYTLPMIIFCVFSSVFAQSPTKVGAVAKAKQEISTKGLVIGDSLPDWFWEQELHVVNHPQKSKTIKLSAYKQQLLVLDFLNTACSGCIKSVDKWNELQQEYRREVAVLPVHILY